MDPNNVTKRRPEIVRITPPDAQRLYEEILQLAELARTGKVNGLAYSVFHPDGSSSEGLLGRARIDIYRAYYAAHRLVRAIWALLK